MNRLPEKSRDPDDRPIKKRRQRDEHWEEAIAQCPWLAKLEHTKLGRKVQRGAASGPTERGGHASVDEGDAAAEDSDSAASEVSVVDEDTFLDQLAEVDKARALIATEEGAHLEDFKTRVLQQAANVDRIGQRYDAVQGYACNQCSVDVCIRRGQQKTKRLHWKHGPATCGVVTRFWCHRMQYFYNVELTSLEGHRRIFDATDRAAYEEPTEVEALLARGPDADVVKAIREIRHMLMP